METKTAHVHSFDYDDYCYGCELTYRAYIAALEQDRADLIAALGLALPYIKTVSRNDSGGYSENIPTLYEDLKALLARLSPQP